MNNFRIGQKVVCIDVEPVPGYVWEDACPLKLEATYTIHALALSPSDGAPAVFLREVKRSIGWPFGAFRFRPAVDRKTDAGMAILTKILTDCPTGVDAPA